MRSVDEQQKKLLRELLELDKAHEAGKMSKAVYEERRAKAKARLRTLISESEQNDQHATKPERREKTRR